MYETDLTVPKPLTPTEIRLSFVASCIEGAAARMGITADEAYRRMAKVGLIKGYIAECYDTLHTQSREVVTDDVVETLYRWEESLCQ